MKRQFLITLLAVAASISVMAQGNRGFRHPGGLHTQADFDRVRAQIAAGNTKVTSAYNKLKAAAYAQPTASTSPVETIVRGGGSGENYIKAARGATIAYQNALRWKIEDNKKCADAAVRVLMAWANTTKTISGDSNYALAAGLYGYQFAQAAELMRDYEGWSREDFETFRKWMLEVWYPSSIGFMRGRNGTWQNSGKWWQSPGHYWSNWGLCNALCLVSIGVLCDDVYIYNQGMSYFKYDQVGNFTDPAALHDVTGHGDADGTQCIFNDGLTEFLGNLVVTNVESELETGAYGKLGQLNESGRDVGHSSMSLGLAIDLAKIGWNQGDDLFAYMDHRLASGIEYLAAQTQSIANLPWTNYMWGSSGYYYSDGRAWLMTEPALGAQMRPYWGTVIGIYEGVKGVKMPFSETAYSKMGIDEGGQGSTSGGYDHLGYSVLMNTRDEQLCPAEKVPTELSPRMEYSGTLSTNLIPSLAKERSRGNVDGKVTLHNELGGLVNTYTTNVNTCVPTGQTIKLMPQLPEGEEDTGQWKWETGETSRDIVVSTDSSHIYRVHYTNSRGVESELTFAIAARGDCTPTPLRPSITYDNVTIESDTIDILYGKTATLSVAPTCDWGTYKWSTSATTQSITTSAINADSEISVVYTNQGGAQTTQTFHLHMRPALPYIMVGENRSERADTLVTVGSSAVLGLTLPSAVRASNVTWSTGETGASITISDIQTTQEVTATFTLRSVEYTITFTLLVSDEEPSRLITPGNYVIRHVTTGLLLTSNGKSQLATFEKGNADSPLDAQKWYVVSKDETTAKYNLISLADTDSLKMNNQAKTTAVSSYPFYLQGARETMRFAIYVKAGSTTKYWDITTDGAILTSATTSLTGFPFELIPLSDHTAVSTLTADGNKTGAIYNLQGQRLSGRPSARGVYIINGRKVLIK